MNFPVNITVPEHLVINSHQQLCGSNRGKYSSTVIHGNKEV